MLAALPAEEYERIAQSLDTVPPKLKTFLDRAGDPVEHVYFPGGGFCSAVTVLKDGGMVEVATIGREGHGGRFAVLPPRGYCQRCRRRTRNARAPLTASSSSSKLTTSPMVNSLNEVPASRSLRWKYTSRLSATRMNPWFCPISSFTMRPMETAPRSSAGRADPVDESGVIFRPASLRDSPTRSTSAALADAGRRRTRRLPPWDGPRSR